MGHVRNAEAGIALHGAVDDVDGIAALGKGDRPRRQQSRRAFGSAGTATTGTTEAEICWNCHDQNNNGTLTDAGDISEWKGFAYNGYTVTGSKSWAS